MAIHITKLKSAVEQILLEYSKGYKASQAGGSCGLQVLSTETEMTISGEVFFDGEALAVQTTSSTNQDGKSTTESPRKISSTSRRSYRQEAQESGLASGSTGIERSVQNENEPNS